MNNLTSEDIINSLPNYLDLSGFYNQNNYYFEYGLISENTTHDDLRNVSRETLLLIKDYYESFM